MGCASSKSGEGNYHGIAPSPARPVGMDTARVPGWHLG